MEDALRGLYRLQRDRRRCVLILIVMEDALRVNRFAK